MKHNMLLVRTLFVALLLMTGLIGGCGEQEKQQAVTGEDVKEEAKEAVETTQPPRPTGACCLPNLSCTESTADDCEAAGGSYHGDGTDCASVQCDI